MREGWRVCPACATPLEPETMTFFNESSSVSSVEEGRFPAGTVLAGRYVGVAIPAVVAAWALWVILSAQRRPATESAG